MFNCARFLFCAFLVPLAAGCQGAAGNSSDGGDPSSDMAPSATGGPDLAMAVSPLCSTAPGDAATAKSQSRNCGIGTGAASFLRAAPYTKMIIEIDSTVGTTPSMAAINHLQTLIADVCGKPGGVTVVMGDTNIPALGHPLTVTDVRAIEDAHRKTFAGGDTAVFYYLIVADSAADDTSQFRILGFAHRASSMVVFQKTIASVSGGLGGPSADVVESTVVAHEFGHVLGLVNLGTKMQANHEDPAHAGHDVNDKCLMYYANNSSAGLANLLGGGTIVDFDPACRADLLAVRNAM